MTDDRRPWTTAELAPLAACPDCDADVTVDEDEPDVFTVRGPPRRQLPVVSRIRAQWRRPDPAVHQGPAMTTGPEARRIGLDRALEEFEQLLAP